MKSPPGVKFKSEAAMCARFIDLLPKDEWACYAETEGWDLLLARKVDGFQIGIQAKLRFNPEVLCQALDKWHWYSPAIVGPDCRAILVPETNAWLAQIARRAWVTPIVVSAPPENPAFDRKFSPELPPLGRRFAWEERIEMDWCELCPDERHPLPEYIPDVPAGAPAPVQLTKWKIKALKIAFILDTRGYVTLADFKAVGLDMGRWRNHWLRPGERKGEWVVGHWMPKFKEQHPVVFGQVAADRDKWWKHSIGERKAEQMELV